MKKSERTKALFLDQLRKSAIIEAACQKIGISRMTLSRWKKEDADFTKKIQEAILEGRLLVNDLAENQLISAVKERNLPAITYWLRHHHPAYANKLEIKHAADDEPLSPEQEALIREALRLASLSQSEITSPNNEVHESPEHNPTGTGGGDDQGQEGTSGDH